MAGKWLLDRFDANAALPAQLPPLGRAELLQVERAMAQIAPDWVVELHDGSREDATLVLVPDSGDDAWGPSFVVSREAYGFRMDQVYWDMLTEVGVFASLADVLATLEQRLALCAGGTVPTSMMVH